MNINLIMCQLIVEPASHEGSAEKERPKEKETQKGACAMRTARLPNHKAAYTAHYWYEPSQTFN